MRERWVEVEGYPNYTISDLGRIANVVHDRYLTPRVNDKGYQRVALCNEDGCREFYIHKLVAYNFLGWPFEHQTTHYNGDLSDNSMNNLYLVKSLQRDTSARPLQEHEYDEFSRQWGKKVMIVETGDVFRSVRDCARYINGDYGCIYACLRGDRAEHRGFTFRYYEPSQEMAGSDV